MALEVNSCQPPGLWIREGEQTSAIAALTAPSHSHGTSKQDPAWAAASLPEEHPTLVEILEKDHSPLLCASCFQSQLPSHYRHAQQQPSAHYSCLPVLLQLDPSG